MNTRSFPSINDLPSLLTTVGWEWRAFPTPGLPSRDFWIGTDSSGNQWLTKLKGAFNGYRELIFDRFAQHLGWSCQSSVFIELDQHAMETFHNGALEPFQVAHWFMPEHRNDICGPACPMSFLLDREIVSVDDLRGSQISCILDWPKSEIAACVFGANEPPGRLITSNHQLVIVDSELMFATGPTSLSGNMWWNNTDGTPSVSGRKLALDVCCEIASVQQSQLIDFLRIPDRVLFNLRHPIEPLLRASIRYAEGYLTGTNAA